MRYLVLLIGFAAFLTLAGPVSVSRAVTDDLDTCAHGSGDAAIAACTQAINSGRWRGSDLAWAYSNRGNRYREKGDNDRAIADLNQAIALDPKLAMAYNNRGIAYAAKGDNDRAVADLNQAIELIRNMPSPTTTAAPLGKERMICKKLWQILRNSPSSILLILTARRR